MCPVKYPVPTRRNRPRSRSIHSASARLSEKSSAQTRSRTARAAATAFPDTRSRSGKAEFVPEPKDRSPRGRDGGPLPFRRRRRENPAAGAAPHSITGSPHSRASTGGQSNASLARTARGGVSAPDAPVSARKIAGSQRPLRAMGKLKLARTDFILSAPRKLRQSQTSQVMAA